VNRPPDERPAPPTSSLPAALPGRGIIRASLAGTVVFTLLAVGAVLVDGLMPPFVVVSLVLFFGGSVVFVLAFLAAVDRSRTEAIGIGGLFFGAGSMPGRVQAALMGSLAVEVVVGVAAAVIRLYTAVAFGTLAPMWALGLAGLWAARHGTFPSRAPELTRAGQRDLSRRTAGGTSRSRAAERPESPE
jgi:hypothetical protein